MLRATPGERARAAADALGDEVLTGWCADLLAGRAVWGDPGLPDVGWVGGRAAAGWGSPERLDDDTRHWSRVWAARTCAGLVTTDDVPRVRAAAARALGVVGEGEHAAALHEAVHDPDVAVRSAAVRALGVLARRLDREI
ncbi:hypothetical protein GCM10023258_15100 [Terrabacter aeriphilus]|uniref:HEAT repeat protein n=1 Tax=Terrabacter aeriphilus TaxID=515662 RepID=A0ABP9J888_9MICO